jgi:hypothetical protein
MYVATLTNYYRQSSLRRTSLIKEYVEPFYWILTFLTIKQSEIRHKIPRFVYRVTMQFEIPVDSDSTNKTF